MTSAAFLHGLWKRLRDYQADFMVRGISVVSTISPVTTVMRNAGTMSNLVRPLLGLMLGAVTCLGAGVAQAQVGLAPIVVQEEMNRNRAQSVLRVSNPTNQPMRIRVFAQPFTYDRDNGFTFLTASEYDLTPYLQFSPREFVVPPGEQQQVRLIALLPPDLPQSEYRAVVFTEPLTETISSSSNTTNIQTRIGSTVYVRQDGAEADLTVVNARWNAETSQIELLVNNAGGATVRPDAQWTLKRGDETLATGKSGFTTVIAGGDRFLRLSFAEGSSRPASGTYELTGNLVWTLGSENYSEPFSTTVSIP